MNVELETLPNCQATLKVVVAPDRVNKERDRVTDEFRSEVRLPGFRPGKAPRNVVAAKYKKDIEEELTRALLSATTREAIREKSLKVLSVMNVEDIEFGSDQALSYKATLLLAPEFELPDYKAIPVAQPSTEVTEEDVNAVLERLREQGADFKEITGRALAEGDFAIVDYTGTIDGKPVNEVVERGGNALAGNTDFWLHVSEDSFLPGFCPNLVGLEVGGETEFDVTLPLDFPLEGLRDKIAHFKVTLKGIRERELPEVDDAFAAKIDPEKNLETLKEAIRENIEESKKINADREKRDAFVNELLSRVDFELPEVMVNQEMRRVLSDIVRENQSRGVSEEELEENKGQLVESATAGARNRVKASFLLVRIAEKEGITVTDMELSARIVAMAQRYDMTPEKLIRELRKRDALDQIREEILVGKVLDFLVGSDSVATDADAEATA